MNNPHHNTWGGKIIHGEIETENKSNHLNTKKTNYLKHLQQ